MKRTVQRITSLLLSALLLLAATPVYAARELSIGTIEGYDSSDTWFDDNLSYDITDEAACWALLQKPITVLDVNENEVVYPLDAPNGKRIINEKQGGTINGSLAAVHVLGENEDGYTKIEGLDYYDRVISGYVKTKLLKTVTPNSKYGIIIDKLTQRLYVFIDGKLWSSCAVSTGLINDKQPYNETAGGEYLVGSWVGGFDSEGMYCEMGIRFNGGDLLHQVPYVTNGDGTKSFGKYEAFLGTKASHGCVRVARLANDDGLNIRWLWDNLKRGTKVVIWDDDGRKLPYPDDNRELYYNPDRGENYHASATCNAVRDKYLPLKGFLYNELDTGVFAKLKPCPSCSPAKRKSVIDEMNLERGVVSKDEIAASITEAPTDTATDAPADDNLSAPTGSNVVITIKDAN